MPLQTPATRARPNLGGSITRNGVTTNYAPSPGQNMDPNRAGSGGTITMGGVTRAYAPTPGRAAPAAGPSPAAMDFLRTGVTPAVPAPQAAAPAYNTYSGAGALQAAQRMRPAVARAPYNPPAQTERKNPLTGDNNYPMEGQTTGVSRAPFIQRGAGLPAGRDALPAPVAETLDEDADIGASMTGTQARLRGTGTSPFARRFGSPAAQSSYDGMLRRVMG